MTDPISEEERSSTTKCYNLRCIVGIGQWSLFFIFYFAYRLGRTAKLLGAYKGSLEESLTIKMSANISLRTQKTMPIYRLGRTVHG